jgi:hypothetical protein
MLRRRPVVLAPALAAIIATAISLQQTLGTARSNNYAIFRASFWHLVEGQNLYTFYPAEHFDLFKYPPTFAVLIAPLAELPYGVGLWLWNLANAMLLIGALVSLLPARVWPALAILTLEFVGAIQNTQSNALVAGLMCVALIAHERQRDGVGGIAAAVGTSVKLFPAISGVFGLYGPRPWRHAVVCAAAAVLLLALPLAVTSVDTLAQQYRWWREVQQADATKVEMAWIGGVLELWTGRALPHVPLQAGGLAWLLFTARRARSTWSDPATRRLLLASLLMFAVVFNHMSESPTFVIAYAGIALWWAALPRERWRDTMVLLVVLLGSVAGSDAVPRDIRIAWHGKTQLKAIVVIVAWIGLQYDLFRASTAPEPRDAAADAVGAAAAGATGAASLKLG